MQAKKITAGRLDRDKRLDQFLAERHPELPKSYIYKIIKSGEVRVNSGRVNAVYRLKIGDEVRVPPLRPPEKKDTPKIFPFTILYEDDDLMAIDKPAGYAVQPAKGVNRTKVVSELLRSFNSQYELIHRIDSQTSGALLVAKTKKIFDAMYSVFQGHQIEKTYLCAVKGPWQMGAHFSAKFPLQRKREKNGQVRVAVAADGQSALSDFYALDKKFDLQLCNVRIKTGRTHQIRVHAAYVGSPIAGDEVYGDFRWNKQLEQSGLGRMFLHAHELSFEQPLSRKKVEIIAPLASDLQEFWNEYRN